MRVDQLVRGAPIDSWLLNEHDMFRIAVPKDNDSLYKSVAEQLYKCQNEFHLVKKMCLWFWNLQRMWSLESQSLEFEHVNDDTKLQVIANAFRREVKLFTKVDVPPLTFTPLNALTQDDCMETEHVSLSSATKSVVLRREEDGHFECIQPISYMKAASIAQSIIYELLYEKVFDVDKQVQDDTVKKVRRKMYNNVNNRSSTAFLAPGNTSGRISCSSSSDDTTPPSPTNKKDVEYPPFPFRVAKSLDPAFYRNAQYDLWLDNKKAEEQQIRVGDKVTLKESGGSGETMIGHVQEILEEQTLVYVEKLGQKIPVDHNSLIKVVTTPKKLTTPRKATKCLPFPSPESDDYVEEDRHWRARQALILPPPNNFNNGQRHPMPQYTLPNQCAPIPSPQWNPMMSADPRFMTAPMPAHSPIDNFSVPYYNRMIVVNPQPSPCQNSPLFSPGAPLLRPQQPMDQPYLAQHQYNLSGPAPAPLMESSYNSTQYEKVSQQPWPQDIYPPNHGIIWNSLHSPAAPVTEPIIPLGHVVRLDKTQRITFPFEMPYPNTYVGAALHASPSVELEGRDLPTDTHTLRFYYNLGIAYLKYYHDWTLTVTDEFE